MTTAPKNKMKISPMFFREERGVKQKPALHLFLLSDIRLYFKEMFSCFTFWRIESMIKLVNR